MPAAHLIDRGVIELAGPDARKFLSGLVTNEVASLAPGEARYAALLTPQGKVMFDFLVTASPEEAEALYIDVPLLVAADLAKRLAFYKLRARVEITDLTGEAAVGVFFDGAVPPAGTFAYPDPRHATLGTRVMAAPAALADLAAAAGTALVDVAEWHRVRVAATVPQAFLDFSYGEVYPHEIDMEDLSGIDFKKGCYVGQEIVSRMQHRGTARTRIVAATFPEGFAAEPGVAITAGERNVGQLGSVAAGRAIALLRLDRVAEAQAAGMPVLAGGVPVEVALPDFAHFGWPPVTAPASGGEPN